MMEELDIVIACGGDWEGLYVDGLLVKEGHKIEVEDLTDFLSLGVKNFKYGLWLAI